MPLELLGSFESTYIPGHDRDVFETTGHHLRWREDLQLLLDAGVTRLRYPVRWHRVEEREGRFDWRGTDAVFEHMRQNGLRPIVDLVHHTSYPRWIERGFADPRFAGAYTRFVEAFFRRYPDVEEYTLFNEPFSTLFLCGHEAIWPPYLSGIEGLLEVYRATLPAISEAGSIANALLPDARHVWIDTCEHHHGRDAWGREYAEMANDRRFFVIDALLGRLDDGSSRPFVDQIVRAGGEDLLRLEPLRIDVLGLDYYAHCQWDFADGGGTVPTRTPTPLHRQIIEYAERYQLPCMLSETNLRGAPSDLASWLKYTLEQCELAVQAGVEMDGVCWFPFIDSADWGSLLARCESEIDPVGVYWLDEHLRRRPSSMARSFAAAAKGTPAAELPAYRFQRPAADWLTGYADQMAHWEWQDPPQAEVIEDPVLYEMELRVTDAT